MADIRKRIVSIEDDPVTNEALALRTNAQQAAPSARA
jgi:hypothetical protein